MEHIDSRWSKEALGEIIGAFKCEKPLRLEEMDGDTPMAKRCRLCEQLFTAGVIRLRLMNGLPVISDLMANVWDVFHHRHVVLAMGPNVPSLSLAVVQGKDGVIQALTFAPYHWPEMVEVDPMHELGAIITIGSQSVDFYNGKILSADDSKISKERSLSYEAEFLRMLSLSSHKLNEYQIKILAKYPNGFDSSFAYTRKPVAIPGENL